jgi:hypothetical protein
MKYKWITGKETAQISASMTKLGKKGWRLHSTGNTSSWWWAVMEKEVEPDEH